MNFAQRLQIYALIQVNPGSSETNSVRCLSAKITSKSHPVNKVNFCDFVECFCCCLRKKHLPTLKNVIVALPQVEFVLLVTKAPWRWLRSLDLLGLGNSPKEKSETNTTNTFLWWIHGVVFWSGYKNPVGLHLSHGPQISGNSPGDEGLDL